jgi:hypothetical protein
MKQQAIHYLGLDLHRSTVVASLRAEYGRVVMRATVPCGEVALTNGRASTRPSST